MDLIESFREECVKIGLESKEKNAVLKEIAQIAKKCDLLENYSSTQIFEALKNRESIGSTAFGDGIAIPHCAFKDINEFVVGLIVEPQGVDFDSTDGNPTKLFVFILGPEDKRNEHVTLLSAISRILNDTKTIDELLASTNKKALAESFLRHHSGHIPHQDQEKCLFHVIIQEEGIFDDIIEIFSSAVLEGDLSIIEAQNASTYLDRIPMFAAFWSDQKSGFCRIILAVVDKDLTNDVVRRINTIVDDLEHRSGILVAVHELMLVRGKLDF